MKLHGYTVLKNIFENPKSSIFRAVRDKDGLNVIVKLLNEEYPSPQDLGRFRLEYETARQLEGNGTPQVYSLEKHKNSLAIVMEDSGGESLKSYLLQKAMPLPEFLELSVKIAEALQEIHSRQIIHKDLNPTNIIYNPEKGLVQIIDFGIASHLTREDTEVRDFNKLEGSLKYISPEQTGRMNRSVKYLSDFYSLGITFYEFLVGKLPFESEDAMEQVHMHIAKPPIPPHKIDGRIPPPLSDIVMKLIEKNAEERYQSLYGLIHDLSKCAGEYTQAGSVQGFEIGEFDLSDTFQIPQKLYGREKDIELMLKAYESLGTKESPVLLVTGYSGIGKSVLAKEIRKPVLRSRGYFIEGKFDQFFKNIPYGAVSIAFKNLLEQISFESADRQEAWKEKLLSALGQNGQVIVNIIPELEELIGKQPPVQELMPSEAKNRLFITFRSFVKAFADKKHPLVLFLDDLQWSDTPTLSLLAELTTSEDIEHFLLVGAYRSNEVDEGHPLTFTLEEIKAKRRVSQITLGPLSESHINEIVVDTLKCDEDGSHQLAALIQQKTDGNPFFINELLNNLHHDNHISFDRTNGCWVWDIEKIRAVEISDNVVEFMLKRLGKLPDEIRDCLQHAASIGNSFDLKTLSIIIQKSPEETAGILQPTIDAGILFPLSSDYRLFLTEGEVAGSLSTAEEISYKFQHDRVQFAAYSLSAEEIREETHLRIGRLFIKSLSEDEMEEKVTVIVRHFNDGRRKINDAAERKSIALLNLKAGRKAKASSAYFPAYQYFGIAHELLPDNHWETDFSLSWEIVLEHAEAGYLSKEFDHSTRLMELLEEKSKDVFGKVEIRRIRSQQEVAMGRLGDAIDSCLQGLSLLGLKIPSNPSKFHLILEMMRAKFYLGKRKIADLVKEPDITDEKIKYCMKLLMELTPTAYKGGTKNFMILVGLKEAVLSLRYGKCPESAFAFVAFGMLQGAVFNEFRKGFEYGKLGVHINEHFNDIELRSRTLVVYGVFTAYWNISYRELEKVYKRALEAGLQSGDHSYLAFSCLHISTCMMESDLRQTIQDGDKYLSIIQSTKNNEAYTTAMFAHRMRLNLAGEGSYLHSFTDDGFDEDEALKKMLQAKDLTGECRCIVTKLENYFYFEKYELCMKQIERVEKRSITIIGTYSFFNLCFYSFLAHSSLLGALEPSPKKAAIKKMKREFEKVKLWANHCPRNFLHHKLLMEAELAGVEGNLNAASLLFDKAIAAAEKSEYLRYQALANERAAKFYLSLENKRIASLYFSEAVYLYRKWGGEGVAQLLTDKYLPFAHIAAPINERETTVSYTLTSTSGRNNVDSLDISSIIKATRTISGEIVLETLLEKMLKIVIENAGAQRGVFILQDRESGGLQVLSEWDIYDEKVTTYSSLTIEEYGKVPVNLVRESHDSQLPVVLHDATENHPVNDHAYFADEKKRSVICYPVKSHGKTIGLIYLENNLMPGAFGTERVELLEILAAQAAISIDNANLYQNLDEYSHTLEQKVEERTNELIESQNKLLQSEKMASLGGLVAGVAHEINTPIGIGVTTASYLKESVDSLLEQSQSKSLKKSTFEQGLANLSKSSDLILRNLKRTAELITSFKMVSTDQTSYDKRNFNLSAYIDDILRSLSPEIRKTSLAVEVECDDSIVLESYPGALAQVITNLVMNSIKHGYKKREEGFITISVVEQGEALRIEYRDDGKGIPKKNLKKIFDPFFTTKRNVGGTGLGLHIVFNAVEQVLQGKLHCESDVGKGALFVLTLPKRVS